MGAIEKSLVFMLLPYGALTAPADGRENENNTTVPDGILQIPLIRIPVETTPSVGNTTKRQLPVQVERIGFAGRDPVATLGIPLRVGTPPQTVIVEPDTGSYKFWVPGLPDGQIRDGPESTFFDSKRSSSIQDLGEDEISGYQTEEAFLHLHSDELFFGNLSLGRSLIGVADVAKSKLGRPVGVLGLQIPPSDHWADDFIPKKLVDERLTKSWAFSANVREAGQGSLIFGGYDAAKFSGPLEKLPMKRNPQNHYIIEMESIYLTDGTVNAHIMLDSQITNGRPLTIGLDSGAAAFQLPTKLFREMLANIGGEEKHDSTYVNCDLVDAPTTLEFEMTDNTIISIPLSDFLQSREEGGQRCRLLIYPGGDRPDMWIGVPFLRRSVVVYDPEQSAVHIARGANCGSNLVAFKGTVPEGITGQCEDEFLERDPPPQLVSTTRPAPSRARQRRPGQRPRQRRPR